MASTPSMALLWVPSGIFTAVTLAGQGEMKNAPTSCGVQPQRSQASFLARRAAISAGASSGSTLSSRSGNRTRISRVTAGQAELMTGRQRCPSLISLRVASLTSSAARATSNTPSNPSFSRAFRTMSMSSRLLNCPYNAGAGSAIL